LLAIATPPPANRPKPPCTVGISPPLVPELDVLALRSCSWSISKSALSVAVTVWLLLLVLARVTLVKLKEPLA